MMPTSNFFTRFQTVLVSFFVLCRSAMVASSSSSSSIVIKGTCGFDVATSNIARRGASCGVPDWVNTTEFGNNMDTNGKVKITPTDDGTLKVAVKLRDLPKSDLVLTAWIVWDKSSEPPIFDVANGAVPCAPTKAGYTSGIGIDANEFKYTSDDRAALKVDLDFNPTKPKSGPLTRGTFSFQNEVPNIQGTKLKHHATPDGVYIPTSSSYLRKYDPTTGFEKLDDMGEPMLARSPVSALGIVVIVHIDKTTHGLSQGVGGVDHYPIVWFPFGDTIVSYTG